MITKEFILLRDDHQPVPHTTLGRLILNGMRFAYTCEDEDRRLEDGGVKIPKRTAIPRGRYRMTTSFSSRFGKVLPILHDVDQFSGVRMHGGNDHEDTEGCPLVGKARTETGVWNCAERVQTLTKLIEDAEDEGIECWITVK